MKTSLILSILIICFCFSSNVLARLRYPVLAKIPAEFFKLSTTGQSKIHQAYLSHNIEVEKILTKDQNRYEGDDYTFLLREFYDIALEWFPAFIDVAYALNDFQNTCERCCGWTSVKDGAGNCRKASYVRYKIKKLGLRPYENCGGIYVRCNPAQFGPGPTSKEMRKIEDDSDSLKFNSGLKGNVGWAKGICVPYAGGESQSALTGKCDKAMSKLESIRGGKFFEKKCKYKDLKRYCIGTEDEYWSADPGKNNYGAMARNIDKFVDEWKYDFHTEVRNINSRCENYAGKYDLELTKHCELLHKRVIKLIDTEPMSQFKDQIEDLAEHLKEIEGNEDVSTCSLEFFNLEQPEAFIRCDREGPIFRNKKEGVNVTFVPEFLVDEDLSAKIDDLINKGQKLGKKRSKRAKKPTIVLSEILNPLLSLGYTGIAERQSVFDSLENEFAGLKKKIENKQNGIDWIRTINPHSVKKVRSARSALRYARDNLKPADKDKVSYNDIELLICSRYGKALCFFDYNEKFLRNKKKIAVYSDWTSLVSPKKLVRRKELAKTVETKRAQIEKQKRGFFSARGTDKISKSAVDQVFGLASRLLGASEDKIQTPEVTLAIKGGTKKVLALIPNKYKALVKDYLQEVRKLANLEKEINREYDRAVSNKVNRQQKSIPKGKSGIIFATPEEQKDIQEKLLSDCNKDIPLLTKKPDDSSV